MAGVDVVFLRIFFVFLRISRVCVAYHNALFRIPSPYFTITKYQVPI